MAGRDSATGRDAALQSALAELRDPGVVMPTPELVATQPEAVELLFAAMHGAAALSSSLSQEPLPPSLTREHFGETAELAFPKRGSAETPPHCLPDFTCAELAPRAFRALRDHFGISDAGFASAMRPERLLMEQAANVKPGQLFAYTADYRFVLRALTRGEALAFAARLDRCACAATARAAGRPRRRRPRGRRPLAPRAE